MAGGKHLEPGAVDGASRVKFDLTINVPTILTLGAFVVSSTVAGMRLYHDIDSRVTRTSYEVSTLQERVRTFEATLAAVKTDQNAQIQTLRAEIRSDLSEIKGTLNNLLLSRKPSQSR